VLARKKSNQGENYILDVEVFAVSKRSKWYTRKVYLFDFLFHEIGVGDNRCFKYS